MKIVMMKAGWSFDPVVCPECRRSHGKKIDGVYVYKLRLPDRD